ncbi:MAG TPA: hypothetical protein DCM28_12005 [Phycisphaerales bacterium]|nr:hypothetical protein [Phycisphaerales bacterium]
MESVMIRFRIPHCMGCLSFVTCLLVSVLALPACAVESAVFPDGGNLMVDFDAPQRFHASIRNNDPQVGSSNEFQVADMPFKNAVAVTSKKIQTNPWDVIVHVKTREVGINAGDVCLLSFWMRSPWSEDESGNGVANVYVELNEAPHSKVMRQRVSAGKTWQQILIPFTAGSTHQLPAGKTSISIHMGFRPQSVELGGFQLINYQKTRKASDLPHMEVSYAGRELDAPWRTEAAKRIEQYRKADLNVNVTDSQGNPISDAQVHVQMTRHAFHFGTAVTAHMLGMDPTWSKEAGDHRRFPYTEADVHKYRQIVEENYNWVVLENDFKMFPYLNGIKNAQQDRRKLLYRNDWLQNALTWLNERDIKVRGHRIFNGRMPRRVDWDPNRKEELRKWIIDQAKQKTADAGTRVTEWDCINHPQWGGNDKTLISYMGEPDFYAKCIAMGKQFAPHAQMWVNEGKIMVGDGGRSDVYENMIKTLIQYNQPPDGIGFMGHYNTSSLVAPEILYKRLERFAPYAPRMQFTELDINTHDAQLQADYLRDVMTVAFSHPKFVGVIQWGFWAGKHWMPEAALWAKDWQEKPSAKAYRDLVFNQWWTDAQLKSSSNGTANVRGFKGAYTITVTHNGKTQVVKTTLDDDGQTVNVKLD